MMLAHKAEEEGVYVAWRHYKRWKEAIWKWVSGLIDNLFESIIRKPSNVDLSRQQFLKRFHSLGPATPFEITVNPTAQVNPT